MMNLVCTGCRRGRKTHKYAARLRLILVSVACFYVANHKRSSVIPFRRTEMENTLVNPAKCSSPQSACEDDRQPVRLRRHVCASRGMSRLSSLNEKFGTNELFAEPIPKILEDADSFQKRICFSQFDKLGRGTKALLVLSTDGGEQDKTHCGVGCRFMRQTMGLWSGLHHEATTLSAPLEEWSYTSQKTCPSRNNDCYFLPISDPIEHYTADREYYRDILRSTPLPSSMSNVSNLANILGEGNISLFTRRSLDAFREKDKFGIPWLKDFSASSNKTGCWVAGQLLWYLLQPNEKLEARVDAEKKRLGWNGRCIALHVRNGWRAKLNSMLSIHDFMQPAKRMPQVKNILLMTEDQSVIDAAEREMPQYNWLYTNYSRSNAHDIGLEMSKGNINPEDEAVNALVNLILSSDCDFFIGRANSTWFRLIILFAYGRYGFMPPFENLLQDWGHGGLRKWGFFGMCTLTEMRKEANLMVNRFQGIFTMNVRNIG